MIFLSKGITRDLEYLYICISSCYNFIMHLVNKVNYWLNNKTICIRCVRLSNMRLRHHFFVMVNISALLVILLKILKTIKYGNKGFIPSKLVQSAINQRNKELNTSVLVLDSWKSTIDGWIIRNIYSGYIPSWKIPGIYILVIFLVENYQEYICWLDS